MHQLKHVSLNCKLHVSSPLALSASTAFCGILVVGINVGLLLAHLYPYLTLKKESLYVTVTIC